MPQETIAPRGASSQVARASRKINAPTEVVWNALVNPEAIERYMFGTQVVCDWHEGHPITWRGEWKGQHFEDKGVILDVQPLRRLEYSHFSPLSGLPDVPENYHHVAIELIAEGPYTTINLTQDGNRTEEARARSEQNWNTMLDALKELLELSYASYPAGIPSYFITSKH